MFSQYMDGKFAPLLEAPQQTPNGSPHRQPQKHTVHSSDNLLGEVTGNLSQLFGGMLKQFSTGGFDTGDILLVLIILFLFLEGDNLELVITLGLMLLLGLGDD